jgi:hypothetical protein
MTFSLDRAIVYDIECLPNCFMLTAENLFSADVATWEISERRDDTRGLMTFFDYCHREQIPMIGFNNIGYDLLMAQYFFQNPDCGFVGMYEKNQAIFADQSTNRFGHQIRERDRFAPQIDLYKINHFDNPAKRTSLKALEVNMRSRLVVDGPVNFGERIAPDSIERDLIPYNCHDVSETKKFALYNLTAINFRVSLIPQFGLDVLNYNDTKIGSKILETKIGPDILFERSGNRKVMRQSPRSRIALSEIIFPYIQFTNPEFQRVLDYMRLQILTPDDLNDPDATIKTKGVFTGLVAKVGGVDFTFGTGGIHASVTAKRFVATDGWMIRDIDVAALYPSIAIVNGLAPDHLGEAFTREYASLPAERREWQARKGKKCVEANTIKLGQNGVYGNSNNKYSPFYDPQYTMTITINGQLMLCMLAEHLAAIPSLQIIQANTDGITYLIHRDYEPQAVQVCKWWQDYTKLVLEDANYSRMWIRDVNGYVAQDLDGKLKRKGPYEAPDPLRFAESISEMQPPGWHKDWSALVCRRAAVAAMVHGIEPEAYIRAHTDPFDFMLRFRATGESKLLLGGVQKARTMRYYVAQNGLSLVKISPPSAGHKIGEWKRAPRITKQEYDRVMIETGGQWDERVCTKSRSVYADTQTSIEAGWLVEDCCDAENFRFDNINYSYYVQEANKLIIS